MSRLYMKILQNKKQIGTFGGTLAVLYPVSKRHSSLGLRQNK